MSHYLPLDGVANYATLQSAIAGTGDFWILADLEVTENDQQFRLFGSLAGFINRVSIDSRDNTISLRDSANNDTTITLDATVLNQRHKYLISKVGTTVTITVDGVLQTNSGTFSGSWQPDVLFTQSSASQARTAGNLYALQVGLSGALAHDWDLNQSVDTYPTLFDVTSGNHATLVDFGLDPFAEYFDILDESYADYLSLRDNALKFDKTLTQVVETNEHLAIDWNADNAYVGFEFADLPASIETICSQNLSGATGSREFHLYYDESAGNTVLRLWLQGRQYLFGHFLQPNAKYRLEIKPTVGIDLVENGIIVETESWQNILISGEDTATFVIGARHDGTLTSYAFPTNAQLKYVSIGKLDNSFQRFYDLNQDADTTDVPELIAGMNGTLVNFGETLGYTHDENGDVVAVYLPPSAEASDGVGIAALDLAPDWAIEANFALDDNLHAGILTKVADNSFNNFLEIDGTRIRAADTSTTSANRVVLNTTVFADKQFHTLRMERQSDATVTYEIDGVEELNQNKPSFNFDPSSPMGKVMGSVEGNETSGYVKYVQIEIPRGNVVWRVEARGDTEGLTEVINNATALFNNTPTSGYLPVLERQVYTVREDGSGDFTTLFNAINGTTQSLDRINTYLFKGTFTARQAFFSDVAEGHIEVIAEDPVTAHKADISLATTWEDSGSDNRLPDVLVGSLRAYGIYSKASMELGENVMFEGGAVVSTSTTAHTIDVGSSNAKIRDSVVQRNGGSGSSSPIKGGTTSSDRFEVTDSILITDNGQASVVGGQVTNVVANTAPSQAGNATTKNTITDFNTSNLADLANRDYRIKQSYADANLVGAGYLGSDIADWAYYDDGGASDNVTIDVSLFGLMPNFSASVTVDNPAVVSSTVTITGLQPSFTTSVDVTLPPGVTIDADITGLQPNFTTSVDVTLPPAVSSDVAFNGLQPTFNTTVLISEPGVNASTVAFNGLQPAFSSSVTVVEPPAVSSDVAVTLTRPTFSADVDVSLPVSGAVVAFNGIQPVFSANVDVTLPPGVTIDAAITGLQPSFSVSVDTDVPVTGAVVAFNGLQPSFDTTVTTVVPEYTVNVGLTGLQPSFSVIIANGEVLTTVTPETNIIVGLQSRDITLSSLSRNINL